MQNDIEIITDLPREEIIKRLRSVTEEATDIIKILKYDQIKFKGNINNNSFNLIYMKSFIANCPNSFEGKILNVDRTKIIANIKGLLLNRIISIIILLILIYSIIKGIIIGSLEETINTIKVLIFIGVIFYGSNIIVRKRIIKVIKQELNSILSTHFQLNTKYVD